MGSGEWSVYTCLERAARRSGTAEFMAELRGARGSLPAPVLARADKPPMAPADKPPMAPADKPPMAPDPSIQGWQGTGRSAPQSRAGQYLRVMYVPSFSMLPCLQQVPNPRARRPNAKGPRVPFGGSDCRRTSSRNIVADRDILADLDPLCHAALYSTIWAVCHGYHREYPAAPSPASAKLGQTQ